MIKEEEPIMAGLFGCTQLQKINYIMKYEQLVI